MSFEGEKSYSEEFFPPEKVKEDAKRLMDGIAMPLDFCFVGKPFPQAMKEAGEHSFALSSAFRKAYMHLDIETDDDGCITDLYYSTYESTGSAYGDMFSRPVSTSDRKEEAMDMLLYIYDRYSEEERETL